MTKGKTASGFVFEIDEKRLSDWEFVKLLAAGEDEDATEGQRLSASVKLVRFMLGKDGEKRLIEHVRDDDGIADAGRINEEISAIFNIIGERRNVKK